MKKISMELFISVFVFLISKMSDDEKEEKVRVLDVCFEKPKKSKKVELQKPRKKRVITTQDSWNEMVRIFQEKSHDEIIDLLSVQNKDLAPLGAHIRCKIRGYGSQDKDKGIYQAENLIHYDQVLELLKTSDYKCHYCKLQVLLLYEYVRDPKQWTLERKDNSLGHTNDNVVLACLNCNIKRKCMHMERYEMTKLLEHIEKVK